MPTPSSSPLPTQNSNIWASSPPYTGASDLALVSIIMDDTNPTTANNNGERPKSSSSDNFTGVPTPRRPSSTETERPPSNQRAAENIQDQQVPDDDSEDIDPDPAEKIADFDWRDLEERYHAAISECEGNEAALLQEWESLMNFFRTWTQSGHAHETDRTYARLQTRMMHVRHSEEELEKKRQHYIGVVEAFQRALDLLKSQFG